jgi:hypothetical protein
MLNIFSHWGGDRKGFGGNVDGTLSIVVGLWVLWAGAFGDEYRWGRGGQGALMPRWLGRSLFTFIGLAFIGGGIALCNDTIALVR